jgi:Na+-driven multidrug efflux pump
LIVMVVQTSIGLIETYFVAKLGLDPLAGMALAFPLYMLLQMVAAGAMGGGILSAIARPLGSNRRDRANELVWYAVAISIGLGALTTVAALLLAPKLYALMGGREGSLAAATTYSALVFAGTIPLWLSNSLAAVIRGTGNMLFPAAVISAGALVLILASPALIFGLGPFPQLGIAGGAAAVVLYYSIGCAIFAGYIWSGRGVLRPPLIPPKFVWVPMRDILRVGAASSVVSLVDPSLWGISVFWKNARHFSRLGASSLVSATEKSVASDDGPRISTVSL